MNTRIKQKVVIIIHLRNRKHFLCFHTVIETRVEVWENENLSSVSITYGNTGMNVFYFFYKISCRKLVKGGISVLYLCPQSVNSPYCS